MIARVVQGIYRSYGKAMSQMAEDMRRWAQSLPRTDDMKRGEAVYFDLMT